jgi:fibronectin type 3 domain-containing protein
MMSFSSMKYYLIILLIFNQCYSVLSQDKAGIGVRSNVRSGYVQLRWAVTTPMAWKQSNVYGFSVERYTVVRNGEILAQPEKVVLTAVPLKPQPLNNWKELATSNNYAAVIAQALYGDDFNLSEEDSKGVSKFIALAQELEQRYLVSMYAADLHYPAALFAGWGLEDKTVRKGERYLYRVISTVPAKTLKIEMGSVYTSLGDEASLPQPQELTAVFGNKSVLLAWNYGILNSVYNSYYLEKSTDGKIFKRLSDTPLTNMNSKNGKANDRMFYTDSLRDNVTTVFYRLIGVTTFSEEGPPSDAVKGEGRNKLIYVPHINRAVPDKDGVLTVEWEFDEHGNDQLRGFDLQRSDNVKGPYVSIQKNIDPHKRVTTYDSLQASNYFVIAAIPKDGEPVLSFPVLVQPSDTIPPSAPVGLKGVVDSTGVVRLSWTANKESDMYGYRIYRAQTSGEELIPLTDNAVLNAYWVDTVDVHNLNSKVYYAVTALDKRYNQSGKSEVVTLLKPELVPPSMPVITGYKLTRNAIVLEWATGGEENLKTIQLFRSERDAKERKVIKEFTDLQVKSFKDSTIQADRFYSYSLVCVTGGGLQSAPSPIVTVQAPVYAGEQGKFTTWTGKFNRKTQQVELVWKHTMKDVKQFEIYRKEQSKSFTLLKTLKGFELKTIDADLKPGSQYDYMIRAILENGRQGAVSATQEIIIK